MRKRPASYRREVDIDRKELTQNVPHEEDNQPQDVSNWQERESRRKITRDDEEKIGRVLKERFSNCKPGPTVNA